MRSSMRYTLAVMILTLLIFGVTQRQAGIILVWEGIYIIHRIVLAMQAIQAPFMVTCSVQGTPLTRPRIMLGRVRKWPPQLGWRFEIGLKQQNATALTKGIQMFMIGGHRLSVSWKLTEDPMTLTSRIQ